MLLTILKVQGRTNRTQSLLGLKAGRGAEGIKGGLTVQKQSWFGLWESLRLAMEERLSKASPRGNLEWNHKGSAAGTASCRDWQSIGPNLQE